MKFAALCEQSAFLPSSSREIMSLYLYPSKRQRVAYLRDQLDPTKLPAKHFLNADDEPIKRCVRVEGKAFSFTSFENPASCPLDLSSMVFLAILKSRLP